MTIIVMFTEGEFYGTHRCETGLPAEAQGFIAGFDAAGRAYGAGSVAAYQVPHDNAEMNRREAPKEVERAYKAVATY